jgi:hypothetical protein
MVLRVLVVPEDGCDGRGGPTSEGLQDRPEGLQVIPICRVARQQEQVDRSEPVEVRGDGRQVLVPVDVSHGRDAHRPSKAAAPMNLSGGQNSRMIA